MPSYSPQDPAPIVDRLAALPGLVGFAEIQRLKGELRAATEGRSLVAQVGDPEETFMDASPGRVHARLEGQKSVQRYLGLMSRKPIVSVGILAGSYARTLPHPTEMAGGLTVTRYYGDMVNELSPSTWGRRPEPNRMLWAYEAARLTLDAMRQGRADTFTSHEGANLHFEEGLVRRDPVGGEFYASSAHLLWLESINLFQGSCHLEFCRGIANPIGLRVGPQFAPAELVALCEVLNAVREQGKLLLVSSFGSQIGRLEGLIRALREAKLPAVWVCDPVQANQGVQGGAVMKDVIQEVEQTVAVHAASGSRLAGLSLWTAQEEDMEQGRSGRFSGAGELDRARPRGHRSLDFQRAIQVCSGFVHAYAGARATW
jgi:3-deoxy-D-arabino-heptulosonate 7-phosphate (DAHP) synthase class II